MILRFVLPDPAKSGLEISAWIDGYDYQNKDTNITILKKLVRYFFGKVYNKKTCDSTIYILLFLPSWTTSWIFYNAEAE